MPLRLAAWLSAHDGPRGASRGPAGNTAAVRAAAAWSQAPGASATLEAAQAGYTGRQPAAAYHAFRAAADERLCCCHCAMHDFRRWAAHARASGPVDARCGRCPELTSSGGAEGTDDSDTQHDKKESGRTRLPRALPGAASCGGARSELGETEGGAAENCESGVRPRGRCTAAPEAAEVGRGAIVSGHQHGNMRFVAMNARSRAAGLPRVPLAVSLRVTPACLRSGTRLSHRSDEFRFGSVSLILSGRHPRQRPQIPRRPSARLSQRRTAPAPPTQSSPRLSLFWSFSRMNRP